MFDAARGMDGLFQVAAGFRVVTPNPARDILVPTIDGGMNVLRAARRAGVKKIVLTSSMATLGRAKPGEPFISAGIFP